MLVESSSSFVYDFVYLLDFVRLLAINNPVLDAVAGELNQTKQLNLNYLCSCGFIINHGIGIPVGFLQVLLLCLLIFPVSVDSI